MFQALNMLWSTISLVAGSIYDNLTDRLLGGELAHEELHGLLVRTIHDTNLRVRCQPLENINASYEFLEEGLCFTSSGNQSNRRRYAQDCFRKSREKATDAFNDIFLSISDRITACLFRITARIHETGYEDLEGATRTSMLALTNLHGKQAIQEMFAVFLETEPQSHLQLERLHNIMYILGINHALFRLCCQNEDNYRHLTDWPEIKLRDSTFHPIKHLHDILAKISRQYELVQLVNQNEFFWNIFASQRRFVVNSQGEVIVPIHTGEMTKNMMVFAKGQEIREVMFPNATAMLESERCSLAVDSNDNVHIVGWRKARDENGGESDDLVLHIFDNNHEIVSTSVLQFIDAREYKHVDIAVNENRSLITIANRDNQVYVCDKRGNEIKMTVTFRQNEDWLLMNMSISHNNEIATVSDDGHVVRIHSRDRTLERTQTFPEGHEAKHVAFRSDTSNLKVLTCVEENDCWFSYSYSETGEYEASEQLDQLENAEQHWWLNNMQTLPTTAVPVAVGKNIAFI